jgi:hypothetical protein
VASGRRRLQGRRRRGLEPLRRARSTATTPGPATRTRATARARTTRPA